MKGRAKMYTFPKYQGDPDGEDLGLTDDDYDEYGKLTDEAHERLERMVFGYDTLTGEEVDLADDGYCVHGVYVGGCGADYMCGLCESGCFDRIEVTRYYVTVTGTGVNQRPIEYVSGQYSLDEAISAAESWLDLIERHQSEDFDVIVCVNEYNEFVWGNLKDED